MKKRKLGKKCLVRAVTLWDTAEFRAGADCHGISRFQSERVCPEWGGWQFFPDSSLLTAHSQHVRGANPPGKAPEAGFPGGDAEARWCGRLQAGNPRGPRCSLHS